MFFHLLHFGSCHWFDQRPARSRVEGGEKALVPVKWGLEAHSLVLELCIRICISVCLTLGVAIPLTKDQRAAEWKGMFVTNSPPIIQSIHGFFCSLHERSYTNYFQDIKTVGWFMRGAWKT